ncbi:DNA mismatch repair protein MutS [Altibacter sp. HG106]|uniref:DNA mismatch repair protein MutS n=1 Tax=Altibacter sp. HG106 TaxID=3023937 RepID=UPI0023509C27|nr:DNA mismatch repair protein MutS [Altibacter sp. HG106]MDC7994603.1 DNA mismatch repair protein MutS [Altibacter sp. HG106]
MAKKVTPLMKQYNSIKAKYPDALLLFRVGDFYETFGSDAVRAAKILNITLTARNNGGDQTELAGFPHHSLHTYLPKLVMAGCRVAICDQLEDPKQTKTIVKRGVTELVTPGVALNDDILESKRNNFLAAVHFGKHELGVAFLDVSTGEFLTAEGSSEYIDTLLQNFEPSEVLVSKPKRKRFTEIFGDRYHAFYMEDWIFQADFAQESLEKQFGTVSLKGFGIDHLEEGIIASGAALYYLSETRHDRLQHITRISRIAEEAYVWMDRFTIRNLELYHSTQENAITLLDVIDKTKSAMGGRLLKRWLALPLKDVVAIQKRQSGVAHFVQEQKQLELVQEALAGMYDLERLISKLATGKINPREVIQLQQSLQAVEPIQALLKGAGTKEIKAMAESLDPCDELCAIIKEALQEEAPVQLSKGNVIAKGYHEALDTLRSIASGGKEYLDAMLTRESERTGITSLKIASNNVFGYYIEVRNTHKDKVPEAWVRKQTLVSAERYITEELKEYEQKILGAEEKIAFLEQQLFSELLEKLLAFIPKVQQTATHLSRLDCLCSFAEQARSCNYKRPEFNDSYVLDIKEGRHPVIERQLPPEAPFIPNDVFLDRETQQLIMITGPNMSGKSAILRQTALIVLLAQMGSFVPAAEVTMGCVDKIFTRVGASDNISMGESTFMVEMNETASILNNISDRSLVLLDEIGRGTSTYDGISIAWAISEYLHQHPARPKTLFATHYHELNEMTDTFERIKNYNVAVKEMKDQVLFLRKLVPGGSHHSFGIHVAKMAGMPQTVLKRSQNILERLEKSHGSEELSNQMKEIGKDEMQLSFFKLDDPLLAEIREEILQLDIDTLTPVEALMKLNEIKRLLQPRDKVKLKS